LAIDKQHRAEVSTFGLSEWILETYHDLATRLVQRTRENHNQIRVSGSMRGFVRNFTYAMSYILVATRYSESITLASLALLQSAGRDILYSLEGMYDSAKSLLDELDNMKNYFDFLDPDLNPSSTPRMAPFVDYNASTGQGMKIVAKDLKFSYPSTAKPVLNGLSFTIEPGELIAIVGGNGSGKSTLVKLLARMFDATSGSIEINGNNIRQYDKDELWSKMSIVNQDFGITCHSPPLTVGKYYNLTVGDNIGIGHISSLKDPLALSTAADIGGSLEFITSFPETFETVMYDKYYRNYRASNKKSHPDLSGGQWQRLALSRAFMRLESADLLLLDEPSASLDPEAEYKLFKGLKEARKKTTVYISHRFNTVRAATRIMVRQHGDLGADIGY